MSLELFLVSNDPLSTNLMTSLGEAMYSVHTPRERPSGARPLTQEGVSLDQRGDNAISYAPTKVVRLINSLSQSWGQESTEIGSIEPLEDGSGRGLAMVNMYLDQDKSFQLKLGEGELKSLESSTGVLIESANRSAEDKSDQIALHKEYALLSLSA